MEQHLAKGTPLRLSSKWLLGNPQKSFPSIFSLFPWSRAALGAQRNSMALHHRSNSRYDVLWIFRIGENTKQKHREASGIRSVLAQQSWVSSSEVPHVEFVGTGPGALRESPQPVSQPIILCYRLFITKIWGYPVLMLPNPFLQKLPGNSSCPEYIS